MFRRARVVGFLSMVFLLAAYCVPAARPAHAAAANVIIPLPDTGKDWAYDAQRGIVYIAGNGRIRRYDLSARAFLEPLPVYDSVSSLALAPDNARLVAGLGFSAPGFLDIDLATQTWHKVTFSGGNLEWGLYDSAFASDNSILFTSEGPLGATQPLRRYDFTNGTVSTIAMVGNRTSLGSSPDRQTIVFAENENSLGAWGVYDVATHSITRRNSVEQGTGWLNYDVGISGQANQFAITTFGGTFIYGADFARLATLGVSGGSRPTGVAFDPTRQRIYTAWLNSQQIRVYDSQTFQFLGAYPTKEAFRVRLEARGYGRLKVSPDGDHLFINTLDGLEVINLAGAPLEASPVDLAPIFDRSVEPAATIALIDSGSSNNNQFYDGYRKNWWTDKYFSNGRISNNTAIHTIAGTSLGTVYQTDVDLLLISARVASADLGSFQYAIPVPASGTYHVELYFAETYWGATNGGPGGSGRRVFNVNAEGGADELAGLDINAEVGPMAALIKRFDIPVSDGVLNLDFKGLVNRPIVSGIAVYLSDPPAAIDTRIDQVWLMNVDTQQPIMPLTDGMTINLSRLPTRNLALKALTVPATVGTVTFAMDRDGAYALHRVENGAPYVYPMDSSGRLLSWTPWIGSYNIKVNAYDGQWAMGPVGRSAIYNVKVIDQP